MSVIIKDMEMPKTCASCTLRHARYCYVARKWLADINSIDDFKTKRSEMCLLESLSTAEKTSKRRKEGELK